MANHNNITPFSTHIEVVFYSHPIDLFRHINSYTTFHSWESLRYIAFHNTRNILKTPTRKSCKIPCNILQMNYPPIVIQIISNYCPVTSSNYVIFHFLILSVGILTFFISHIFLELCCNFNDTIENPYAKNTVCIFLNSVSHVVSSYLETKES